jgi:hypothetical protein
METPKSLDFAHVAFSGSSFREYELFFNMDPSELKGKRILDCPSGAASFAADAKRAGIDVVAVDPLFNRSIDQLRTRGTADIDHVSESYRAKQDMLYWEVFPGPEALEAQRRESLKVFCEDFAQGQKEGRYISSSLPNLPFGDKEFDLVLSGHLLFLYSAYLDYDFHLLAIRELLRVSRGEVRIYPIKGLDTLEYPEMKRLLCKLRSDCSSIEVVPCKLRLIRGFEEFLSLRALQK